MESPAFHPQAQVISIFRATLQPTYYGSHLIINLKLNRLHDLPLFMYLGSKSPHETPPDTSEGFCAQGTVS